MSSFPELHRPDVETTAHPVVMLHGGVVANWMWEPQVAALSDRVVFTPDLPGFGARVREGWPGLDAVADDVVARVAAAGIDGSFDLVGLSLGAVAAIRVMARHPSKVRSAFITGAPLEPGGAGARLLSRLQLALWEVRWFWRVQATAFRLREDARELYIGHGLSVRRETASAMAAEVHAGGVPTGVRDYAGPVLAIAGEKDSAAIRRSLAALVQALPQAQVRLAPGMHHVWNVEDVSLFNGALHSWLRGRVGPRLVPPS